MNPPFRILCVCMANVCRSPTAEAVLRRQLRDRGLGGRVEVASAGTHGFRTGEAADRRTSAAAWARGYDLAEIRARKIGWRDFDTFDLILAMDHSNLAGLRRLATAEQAGRLRLLMEFSRNYAEAEVPDPLLTLGSSFEHVLAMIEDACRGVVDAVETRIGGAPVRPGSSRPTP
jgi:protein-tyrosine phosphatase